MLFMNKHHEVSFSYHFIFGRIMCALVTFYEREHFVMLIIESMHLINCISGHICYHESSQRFVNFGIIIVIYPLDANWRTG